MSIEQNIANRKQAEQVDELFNTMLDVVRDDFKRLAVDQRKRFLELAHDRFSERLDLPCCKKNQPLSDQQPPKLASIEADEAISELMEIIEMCNSVPLDGRTARPSYPPPPYPPPPRNLRQFDCDDFLVCGSCRRPVIVTHASAHAVLFCPLCGAEQDW